MTLTLGKSYKADDSERENKVYFVDYFMNRFQNRKIDKALYSILKKYDDCEFYELTHIYKKSSDIKGCFAEAQNLLKMYAKASLVITKRIHCSLPCLAMGTPVILITKKFDKKRFKGLISFFNYIGKDVEGKFTVCVNEDSEGFVCNSNKHLKYKEYLTKISESFARKSTASNIADYDSSSFKFHQKPKKISKSFLKFMQNFNL